MYTCLQYTCTYTPSYFPTEGYVYAPSVSMIRKNYMVMYLLLVRPRQSLTYSAQSTRGLLYKKDILIITTGLRTVSLSVVCLFVFL